jgi:hypothetical protein
MHALTACGLTESDPSSAGGGRGGSAPDASDASDAMEEDARTEDGSMAGDERDATPEGAAGETGSVSGSDVVFDNAGRIALTGSVVGTVDLGIGPVISAGGGDLLLAQFDASAAPLWNQRFGDAENQGGGQIALDTAGNVVLATSFGGALDLGGDVLSSAGASDICLASFDAGGAHVWSKRFGTDSQQLALDVAVDSSDRIVLAAFSDGAVDFGAGTEVIAGEALSIAKFESTGAPAWQRTWPGVSRASLAINATDAVLIAGSFRGNVDFGGEPLVSAGLSDIFVLELSPSGDHRWSARFGGSGDDVAAAMAVDSAGNLLLTGSFDGVLDFGGAPLVSVRAPMRFAPSMDLFVAKLDPSGNHVWSKQFGDAAEDQQGITIDADDSDHVALAGWFRGSVDFGFGPLEMTSDTSSPYFVVKLDGVGAALWSHQLDGTASRIRSAPSGNVLVAGSFPSAGNFTPALRTVVAGSDVFLVEFPP